MSAIRRPDHADANPDEMRRDATKAERNRLWREENRAAHAAYAHELAREGLPLAAFRTF